MESLSPTHLLGVFTSSRAVTVVPIPAVTSTAQMDGNFLLPLPRHTFAHTAPLPPQVFKLLPGFPCWVMTDGERHCNVFLIAGGIFLRSELLQLPQFNKIPVKSLCLLPPV